MPSAPPTPESFALAELATRLGLALAFGLLLGLEREIKGKSAGLRTHALVALSSAALTLFALDLASPADAGAERDPLRVIQGVAQAIGLLCAGMIIHGRGGGVRNLTTAATLWTAAAMGIACGAGYWPLAALTAAGVMLTLLFGGIVKRLLPHSGED